MATTHSSNTTSARRDRRQRRRQATIEEALDHAVAIMGEEGVGALTVSEVARRMGIRSPSLYKYFPSLHAVYDAVFARGLASLAAVVDETVAASAPGVQRLRAGTTAVVCWCTENAALAQLLFWRPVPGFEPSAETFAHSISATRDLRAELTEAVRRGELHARADSDEAARMLTVVMSGLISQQLANEPGVAFGAGSFTRLTDQALDMFMAHFAPGGGD